MRNHLFISPTLITLVLFFIGLPSALPQPASLNLESSESLLQLDGGSFDLNQYRNQKAVVLVAHAASCPVMRQNYPAFKALSAAFKAKSVAFIFINPLSTDSKQKITEEIANYDLGSELFVTETKQKILLAVGLRTVGQAAVLIPKGEKQWDIVFRGGISDRVNFDRATEKPSKKYLEMALDDVLKKRKVRTAVAPTFGCSISDP